VGSGEVSVFDHVIRVPPPRAGSLCTTRVPPHIYDIVFATVSLAVLVSFSQSMLKRPLAVPFRSKQPSDRSPKAFEREYLNGGAPGSEDPLYFPSGVSEVCDYQSKFIFKQTKTK
jgi:hypothetical protein